MSTVDDKVLGLLAAHPEGLTKEEIIEKLQAEAPGRVPSGSIRLGQLALEGYVRARVLEKEVVVIKKINIYYPTEITHSEFAQLPLRSSETGVSETGEAPGAPKDGDEGFHTLDPVLDSPENGMYGVNCSFPGAQAEAVNEEVFPDAQAEAAAEKAALPTFPINKKHKKEYA